MIGRRKRFWADASVINTPDGFGVALDGKLVSTPAKARFILPTATLAEAVAAEWQCVEGEIDPTAMRFTRLANSAIDKVRHNRSEIAQMLGDYGGTDLVCYRAAEPAALAARQSEAWDPLLDWVHRRFQARLSDVSGVMFQAQDEASLQVLQSHLHGLDNFTLTGLHDLVVLSGSLVIGLAVHEGHLRSGKAWALSRIDETWQSEQWGEDAEASAAAETKQRDFDAAVQFLRLLKP